MKHLPLLLSILLLPSLVVPAVADNIVYSNGPINGTITAWTINDQFAVSDSFTLSATTDLESIHFGVWTDGGLPLVVGYGISTAPFGTTYSGTGILTSVFQFTNCQGFNVYWSSFTFPSINLAAGTYYITLFDGFDSGGGPLAWDENDGPSLAFETIVGLIGSESFSLDGNNTSTPEPETWIMVGSGILGTSKILRRRIF